MKARNSTQVENNSFIQAEFIEFRGFDHSDCMLTVVSNMITDWWRLFAPRHKINSSKKKKISGGSKSHGRFLHSQIFQQIMLDHEKSMTWIWKPHHLNWMDCWKARVEETGDGCFYKYGLPHKKPWMLFLDREICSFLCAQYKRYEPLPG